MYELVTIILIFATTFMLIDIFLPEITSDSSIQRRLTEVKEFEEKRTGPHVSEEVFKSLAKKEKLKKSNLLQLIRENSDYRIQFVGAIINKFKFMDKIKYSLKIADIRMPVDVFVMGVFGSIFLFLIIGLLTKNILILLMSIVPGVFPFMFIKMKFVQRKEKFTQQFPEALGIISNSLRAGHSLLSAFQTVASESDYPVNKIFKNVSDEISLGREVRDTLINMGETLPGSEDLKFFVTAVLIQREVGGNLAEILDNLNNTIRERYKLLGLIKTQTAQAQLSGIVLGLAPAVIAGLVSMINPAYMEPLYTTPMGMAALVVAIFMSLTGFLIIKQVTQIKV